MEMIINSASRLNSLVNDILDFSKLQKQQLEIQHKPVDLFQVTENSLALLKPLHREKPIDLQNELTKDLPLVVETKTVFSRFFSTYWAMRSNLLSMEKCG